ncbi:hypothetical protein [Mycobacterium sp. AZCC_0083]|uniref:hypothetical protein n=1 Tax=Mycobacterium sp. AZCC_0083 TaxID=2735882 RepID=UPI00160B0BE3|nr:hypothetical protein [Mycobacterium sp. AZCC_0083]MBB5167107.1 hypothetical protein [Mycobacterium sp. AZCC_0083]
MSETFYVAVDPKGAYHQSHWSEFTGQAPNFYIGSSYDDPSPRNEIKHTGLRLFASPKNWLQKQRRRSERGVTGGRMFELVWDGTTLTVGREIEGSTNPGPKPEDPR